ncbi:MAG: MerR family transcriptional regulator [Erysipelotrichaceae bacterium]|nr:MerR family transcriptional regulator [Erysipelotrichaceae bacterium]
MFIKEVTNQYPITRKALLTYEEKGLIHPKRNLSGYRDYSDEDIITIKKIIILRKMNFSLNEIEEVLQGNIEWRGDKMKQFDDQIQRLQIQKSYIPNLSLAMMDLYDIDQLTEELEDTFDKDKEINMKMPYSMFVICMLLCLILMCVSYYFASIYLVFMTLFMMVCIYLYRCLYDSSVYLETHTRSYIPYCLCFIGIIGMVLSSCYYNLEVDLQSVISIYIIVFAFFIQMGLFQFVKRKQFAIKYNNKLFWICIILMFILYGFHFYAFGSTLILWANQFYQIKSSGVD